MRLHEKTVLQKTALLVKAGMMEPPKWYAAIKKVPPFHRRPSNGIEQLTLPWDKLATEFTIRNPHMVDDAEWLGPNGYRPGAPPISFVFAKRQYALMQNGFKKEEAYTRTHDSMKAERAADVAAIRRMVKEASAISGSRPSFVADDDVYSGLRYWQTMLKESPYEGWDLAAKEALNVFLRREVLDWDDEQMKFARSAKDGSAEAVEAEIKRLRVTLFPETKSDEYAYPSDVLRPMEEENTGGEIKEEEGTELHDTEAYDGEEKEEWKSAVMVGDWKYSLKRFREMAEEIPYELDWSLEDRQNLANFILGRCVRRAVLEEAFSWVPDPVAETLAKIENERSRLEEEGEEEDDSTRGATLEEELHGNEVGRETMQAEEKSGIEGKDFQVARPEEKEKEDVVEDENWLAGEDLEGFQGDWMAVARMRTGRAEPTMLAKKVRKGKGKGKAAMAANAAGLEGNMKAVLTQAKRQLFPDLVLEEDEKSGKESPEARRERVEAKKKIVLADLEWKNEEVEAERNAMINKLKARIGPQKSDRLEEIRAKRFAKGTWKAERRRLLKLEKQLYQEQQSSSFGMEDVQESGEEDELDDIPDTIFESEFLKNKAKEFYAKEKARMKKNAKLQAEAAAAGEELKARAKSSNN